MFSWQVYNSKDLQPSKVCCSFHSSRGWVLNHQWPRETYPPLKPTCSHLKINAWKMKNVLWIWGIPLFSGANIDKNLGRVTVKPLSQRDCCSTTRPLEQQRFCIGKNLFLLLAASWCSCKASLQRSTGTGTHGTRRRDHFEILKPNSYKIVRSFWGEGFFILFSTTFLEFFNDFQRKNALNHPCHPHHPWPLSPGAASSNTLKGFSAPAASAASACAARRCRKASPGPGGTGKGREGRARTRVIGGQGWRLPGPRLPGFQLGQNGGDSWRRADGS